MSRILVATFLVMAFTFGGIASAQMWDYSPLTKSLRGEPFKMTRIAVDTDGAPLSFNVPAGFAGIDFRLEQHDGSLILNSITGKDGTQQSWRVEVGFGGCSFPSDFFLGDLDKNGMKDLVLLVPTCGNGLAPSVHLFALLFDENGRPVPFEADGYFEGLPSGIDALVDMNHDGKAELIYMNFNDGYWITNIYRCENTRWHLVKGRFAGKEYPLFTRFTNRPNRKAIVPKTDRHPFAPDLSNDTPLLAGKLASFNISERSGTDVELNVRGPNGTHIKCTPACWYGSTRVVLDGKNGRQIIGLSRENKENVSPILNRIISGDLDVLFYGKRYRDKCSPEILWATEKN